MMTHDYESMLVILSVVIAMLASYAALNLAAQVTSAEGSTRWGWLAGGAMVMGVGIWSMHFVAMLAFHLPVPITYALPLVLLSVAVAIAASLLALYVASRIALSGRTLLSAGLLMGIAIAGMHYVGMASINAAARLSYSLTYVIASVAIAIAASVAALWLAFRVRTNSRADRWVYKISAAVVMGAAISGMHYTAMAGARFAPGPMRISVGSHFLATDQLGQAIALGSLLMIVLNLLSNAVKFTPRGGTILIRAFADVGQACLTVTDTGIGIPEEMLGQIFDRFVQVDTTAAGRAQGTGLGLAISRDLARGMNGDLRPPVSRGGEPA